MTTASSEDLLAHARATRVVVLGGGIAGLVSALECASVGLAVTLVEASDHLGGAVASADLDGVVVDVGADAYPAGGTAMAALLDELGLGDAVVAPATDGCWIATPGVTGPVPADTLLGIPVNPWAEDVRRVIGWRGAWRAHLDRLRPPLTIGHERRLGALVRSRQGARVVERLLAPLTRGLFGLDPDAVGVEAASPRLSAALTRTGSLGGAVADVLTTQPALPARASLEGGMTRLVAALVARLRDLDVEIRTGAMATAATRTHDGFAVRVAPDARAAADVGTDTAGKRVAGTDGAAVGTDGAAAAAADTGVDDAPPAAFADGTAPTAATRGAAETGASDPERINAAAVIVALPGGPARGILSALVPALPPAPRTPAAATATVTLLVDAAELDDAPRGRAVFSGAGAPPAALAHATAEWAWLAAFTGGAHVLRVRIPDDGGSDEQLARSATDAAAGMTGAPLTDDRVRAAHVARWGPAPAASDPDLDGAAAAVRAVVHTVPGLTAVGAWLAGSDIDAVVTDARREAERIRRHALWVRA